MKRPFGVTTAMRAAIGGIVGAAALVQAGDAWAVEPHLTMATLSSSNGRGALVFDATQYKITEFLEHAYQAADASTLSRNFAYDSYPGIRVGSTGTWLNTVAPTVTEYLPATGIIHTQRSLSGLTIDEYDFAPMSLAANASVMLVKVTQTGTAGPVDLYSLFNYHLGSGSPTPGTDSETIGYDGTRDVFYESGPSGVAMAYTSITPSTHHGCTPNNPFALLNSGSNLDDDSGDGGPTTDAVEGFQSSLGTLALGTSAWAGWVTVLAPDANGQNAIDGVRSWTNGRTSDQILSDELAGWASWITPAPTGASATEAALQQQSQAMLRMAQVTEPGTANGQITAAITPGEWNITWVRDMAYATVALVKSGHYAEAKAALAFQMGANTGGYASYLSNLPYKISVCRYYGNGDEWSDSNGDGPNIEFDGFGLFLWALGEYVAATNDTTSLAAWWPTVKADVADTLVALQESTGMIAPDSSIWEVHWDGQQRHFAYTTATAANGLCSASRLATLAGDAADAPGYLTNGARARDALISQLRGSSGALGQSTEAIQSGVDWLDASPIEAFNWGLLDPKGHTAVATRSSMQASLVPASGRGFMRDQTGAYYDSQEWVFIDLRSERAFELGGATAYSADLFAWNTGQGAVNYNELSELHDATTANYAGAAPMMGFGAGAYILALHDRGTPVTPSCGSYAVEPSLGFDAGPDTGVVDAGADAGPTGSDATPGDAGTEAGSSPDAALDAKGPDGSAGHDASGPSVEGGTPDAVVRHDGSVKEEGGPTTTPTPPKEGGTPILPSFDAGPGLSSESGSSGGCAVGGGSDGNGAGGFVLPLLGLAFAIRRKRSSAPIRRRPRSCTVDERT